MMFTLRVQAPDLISLMRYMKLLQEEVEGYTNMTQRKMFRKVRCFPFLLLNPILEYISISSYENGKRSFGYLFQY